MATAKAYMLSLGQKRGFEASFVASVAQQCIETEPQSGAI